MVPYYLMNIFTTKYQILLVLFRRYVGTIDCKVGTGTVSLRSFPKSHPFAQLNGADNIISFTTQRYMDCPLIIRGPGAGAEVTAGGVFSDMLKLA